MTGAHRTALAVACRLQDLQEVPEAGSPASSHVPEEPSSVPAGLNVALDGLSLQVGHGVPGAAHHAHRCCIGFGPAGSVTRPLMSDLRQSIVLRREQRSPRGRYRRRMGWQRCCS